MSEINLKLKTHDQLTMEIAKLQIDILCKDKEIEKLNNRIDNAIEKLKEHKKDLDYEPWSIYQINGSILFDLVNILKGSDEE